MDIKEILALDPNSECKIHVTFTEEWDGCYYQYKKESNPALDPNKLPLLDDEYLGETGEPLFNDKGQEVYDPLQKIESDSHMIVEQTAVYTSKSFISLIQKKIKELIDSEELSSDSYLIELFQALGISTSPDSIVELFNDIECKDYVFIEGRNEYDNILWLTALELSTHDVTIMI